MKSLSIVMAFTLACAMQTRAGIYIGPGTTLMIGNATYLHVDSLSIIPSVDLLVTDNTLSLSYAPVVIGSAQTIARVYNWSNPLTLNGEVGIYYALGELNGNVPLNLQLAYNPDTSWIITSNSAASVGFVVNNFTSSTSLKKISAATSSTPLPVSIFGFVATAEQSWVRLEWKSGQKDEFDQFLIERSVNGVDFSEWLSIPATSAKNYTEFDDMPLMGNNYYRLFGYIQGDKKLISPVQRAYFERPYQMPLIVYPQPVGDEVNIVFNTQPQNGYLTLFSAVGQLLKEIECNSKDMQINMAGLPSGMYLLRYSDPQGETNYKLTK